MVIASECNNSGQEITVRMQYERNHFRFTADSCDEKHRLDVNVENANKVSPIDDIFKLARLLLLLF
jgi:hypothetical protein